MWHSAKQFSSNFFLEFQLLILIYLFSSNARADTLKGFYFVPHFNLFTYAKWSPTSGDELKTWSPRSLSGLGGWILGSDMSKSYQLFSNYNGSSVGYKYKKIFIEAGVAHSYEKIAGVEIIEKQTIGYTRSRTISNYVVNYLQIPFRMGINFPDKNSSYKLTFISAGLNFDFVFAETKDYGHERYYYPNGQAIPYSQEKLLGRNKFRFNKISPFVYLGREKYSKTGRVSFKYGIMLVFKSFFQKHNTGEYLKNYKISPLIFGWAYHF